MNGFRLNPLTLTNFRGDFYGGLTAAVVALPLAIAFGVASGAGPVAGLYGAICVGLFASLFGGTPSQISGPTGPMTIVSATVFTQFGDRPLLAFTVVMMAGAMQMLFGYLRFGRYIQLMPYPVVSGFMTGIGCILIIMQLDPLLGHPSPTSVINALSVLPEYLLHPQWQALLIGGAALLVCLLTPAQINRVVPAPLIAIGTGVLLGLVLPGASVLGEIPSGFPALQLPSIDLDQLAVMVSAALVLAALGSIDSLLTSLVADNVTRTFHDSDKELIGQGLGNIAAGLLGGIPGAGATIRTLTNIKVGGRTALSGTIHAIALLGIALGLGPLVAYIPYAALAGVLIKVGLDVIDWRYLRRFHRMPKSDRIFMLIVLILTVAVDVITAVAVGVVLASLAFVKQMADLQGNSMRAVTHHEQGAMLNEEERVCFQQCEGKVLLLHMSGLISFGAATQLTRKLANTDGCRVLIIDLADVPAMDGSAALAVEEIIERATANEQIVVMSGMNYAVARLLSEMGTLDRIRDTHRFPDRLSGIRHAAELIRSTGNFQVAE